MNQAVIVTIAVLAFLALAFFCMRTKAPAIEAEIESRAVAKAEEAGMEWAQLVAEGRSVTIRGTAPSAEARRQAGLVIGGVEGLRNANNELQLPDEVFSPVAVVQAYETRMTVSAGFVRYSGFVPDRQSRDEILAQTRKLFGSRRFEDEMVLREDPPENWMAAIRTLQQRFSTYASAEAVMSGNRLNVIGAVAPGREGERQLLAASLPSNFKTEIILSIARSESIEMCQQRLDELMRTRISFEVASEVIRSGSYDLLDQLAERIAACGGLRIEVAGHTDSEGLAMKNLELSQRRAEAVTTYLVNKGIDMDQLVPWGYGESRPVEDNGTASGRAANRRIEFKALD